MNSEMRAKGGLILCDKERYAEVKAQMEREAPPEAPKQ
jgi:hypothetical protein